MTTYKSLMKKYIVSSHPQIVHFVTKKSVLATRVQRFVRNSHSSILMTIGKEVTEATEKVDQQTRGFLLVTMKSF